MGLLDSPENSALLQLGLGLLSAGGPSRTPISLGQAIGSAGGQAMDAYRQTEAFNAQKKARALQEQLQQMQLGEAQRKAKQIETQQGYIDQLSSSLDPQSQALFRAFPELAVKSLIKEPKSPQLVEVEDPSHPGRTIKKWVTPGASDGVTVGSVASKESALPWYVNRMPDGSLSINPAFSQLEREKASFARPPAQPMAPVTYLNDQGQAVWGTINEARGKPAANFNPTLQAAVTGAKTAAKERAEGQVQAEMDYPRVESNASNALRLSDELLKHPGFGQAVGKSSMLGIQKIPGTNAYDFMNRLGQLRGGAFLEAFNTLKGGGQITEVEGKKATDAIARMDNATTEDEFKAAVLDYQSVIRSGLNRVKMRAKPIAPMSPNQPSVDDLVKKYGGQ